MKFSTSPYGMNGQFSGDIGHVQKALSLFIDPAQSYEIRTIFEGGGHPCVCGDLDEGLAAVREGGSAKAIFWILNPVEPGCKSASKKTVLCRRWLLIDIDPTRPADVSATDAEKAAASLVVSSVLDYLTALGWPAPVINDSGNGWHLLYRVDLPNDNLSQQIIKSLLIALAERFDTEAAHIDRATHDAPRPCKLPGTWARKGENTPDRPHRIARITYEPEAIEPVTIEQLQAAIGTVGKPAAENGTPEPLRWSKYAGKPRGVDAYVRSALERECFKVALATEGERNNVLNIAAFNLGTMAEWPEMDEQEARATLIRSGERAGLQPRECLLTVASGWESGKKKPRDRPQDSNRPVVELGKLTIGLDEIVPEKVDWFWENIVAPGFFSLFAGRTGMGKSFVTCDLVARLSRGDAPAFSALKRKPMRTLFISEDPPNIMLGPRLLELNADKKMVRFMRYEALSIWTLSDLEMLANCWEESGRPELIVIDPPSNFLGDIDEHKNAALRGVLMPVVSWLGANRVACIMITHINKQVGKGLDAVGRIMGSVAWASTARVTMAFDKDPQTSGQFLMGASKNNLGPLAGTLAYKIVKTDCLAAIEWIGPVDTDADAMVNQTKTPRRVTAAAFLDEQFRLKRCWASDELIQLARGAGISRNALFEAKGILPIRAKQVVTQDGMRFWEWQAQPEWPEDPPKKAVETLGTLGRCQPKSNDDNTHRTVSMRASDRDTETQFQSPRVSEFQSESTEEEVQRATRQLAGILMSGHVDRDRVVVIASELKVDLWVLNQAADRLGVRRTVEEGKEVWTLP